MLRLSSGLILSATVFGCQSLWTVYPEMFYSNFQRTPAQRANFRGALGSVKDIHHLTSDGQVELNCQLILLRPRCLIYFRENNTSIIQLMHSLFSIPGSELDRRVGRDKSYSSARLHN